MKYRIVQRKDGFIIEKSRLGLFWKRCPKKSYSNTWNSDRFWTKSYGWEPYRTLAEAKTALGLFRSYPFRYKGHKIDCGLQTYPEECLVYIDLNTGYKKPGYGKLYDAVYIKGSKYPNIVKGWIDSVEDGKSKPGEMRLKVVEEKEQIKAKLPW